MNNLRVADAKVISELEAQSLLNPYFDALANCISGGWEAWETFGAVAPGLRMPLGARTRASFVYDHIIQLVRDEFSQFKNVRISEKSGFVLLDIDGKVVIRFKKLSPSRRARNYPTNQQLLFSLQMELPGIPDATRLIAGYRLDKLQTQIQDLLITCPVGSRLEWFFELPGPSSMVATLPSRPAPAPVAPKVTAAKGIQQKKTEKQ